MAYQMSRCLAVSIDIPPSNQPQELTSREEHQGEGSPSRRGSQLRGGDVGRTGETRMNNPIKLIAVGSSALALGLSLFIAASLQGEQFAFMGGSYSPMDAYLLASVLIACGVGMVVLGSLSRTSSRSRGADAVQPGSAADAPQRARS